MKPSEFLNFESVQAKIKRAQLDAGELVLPTMVGSLR